MKGGPFQGPDDVLVDDFIARQKHVKVGDTMEILNHQFRICGIVENGRGARKFVPMATMQDLNGAKDKASVFYVKLDDPANTDAVVDGSTEAAGDGEILGASMQEYLSMMTPSNLPGFRPFIGVVIGVSLVIGFLVIFQSMYTAVMERTREIGILKSMGASKCYIVNVILRETVLAGHRWDRGWDRASVCWRGWGLCTGGRWCTSTSSTDWMIRATVVALVGATVGALYPAYKAAQKDPIDALAYE